VSERRLTGGPEVEGVGFLSPGLLACDFSSEPISRPENAPGQEDERAIRLTLGGCCYPPLYSVMWQQCPELRRAHGRRMALLVKEGEACDRFDISLFDVNAVMVKAYFIFCFCEIEEARLVIHRFPIV
jgi:hypothetical protein